MIHFIKQIVTHTFPFCKYRFFCCCCCCLFVMWAFSKSGHACLFFFLLESATECFHFFFLFPLCTGGSQTVLIFLGIGPCLVSAIEESQLFFQFTDNDEVNGWDFFLFKIFLTPLALMLLLVCSQRFTDYKMHEAVYATFSWCFSKNIVHCTEHHDFQELPPPPKPDEMYHSIEETLKPSRGRGSA